MSYLSQHYGVTWILDYAVTSFKPARWKVHVSSLRHKPLKDHGFVGYPFDYRVILGFGSIAGGLDHVNPVIRLPLEHGISRRVNNMCRLKGQTRRIVDSNGLIPGLTTLEALKSIQELADHSHKWNNEESKNTLTSFGIIAEKLKALNHEMDELKDDKVPIILGKPMLTTAHARIDVFGKKISLEVGTEQITLDINERESTAVILSVCVTNNLSEINEFDEPRDLEEFLLSDDDLSIFPSNNDLLPNLENQDTKFLSPLGSARLNDDSMKCSVIPTVIRASVWMTLSRKMMYGITGL
uniref:Reverse transcriptase domain-containing protein n=1 Tax=Tanacetum cinerariifolium TaxID=118510 RepID=A0A6L2KB37_TANCI|nr:hypothetical protein [Tanacetum cinerariifolium]